MGWIYLMAAILLEVCGTTCMKFSNGLTKILPTVCLFIFYVLSFTCMTFVLKHLEMSIAYAVWAGLGTLLITLVGIFWFGESASVIKLLFIMLIIVGAIGLNLTSQTP